MTHVKHFVANWYSKGHKTTIINEKLKVHFGQAPARYSTVTLWCRELKLKYDILDLQWGCDDQ
jgi:hypothetical protein